MMYLNVFLLQFRILMVDRILFPIVGGLMVWVVLAYSLSSLTLDDFRAVLLSMVQFTGHIIGTLLAIYWAVRTTSAALRQRQWDVFISRGNSRLGVYVAACGAYFSFLILSGVLLVSGASFLVMYGVDQALTWLEMLGLSSFILEWWVLGSFAVFLSFVVSENVALFASIGFWLFGRSLGAFLGLLPDDFPPLLEKILRFVNRFIDLQVLQIKNLAEPGGSFCFNLLYAALLSLAFLAAGAMAFERRDLT